MARIALDIDSTLHHYWDLLDRIAQERYGVALPYAEQSDWGITALERDQLIAVVEETHSDENIEAAEPYEGAVEAVQRWHEAGHWIHVTSHRRTSCDPATRRWLEATRASPTTTCTAPSTRSPAAWSWTSTSWWTTAR